MRCRTRIVYGVGLIISIFIMACGKHSSLDEFTFSFSAESIENYKTELTVNSDSIYSISKHNYFFDNFEGKRNPQHIQGRLTAGQFNTLKKLLIKSELYEMKDNYGFDEEENSTALSDVIYQIKLSSPGSEKFVTIKSSQNVQFAKSFLQLISFSADLMNEKVRERELQSE